MKRWFGVVIFVLSLATVSIAAAKGPEVDLVDNKLSINVEAISLGRLLGLVDLATGMKSKVPPELANRNISVKFSGLSFTDGVRKIFQGQPLDYVVIGGQGVIVTAASQTASVGEPVPAYNNSPQVEQPFVQDFPPIPQPGLPQPVQPQQPATIQTPFGPIANPRAQQGQPNAPVYNPQNTLFPQPFQTGQPNQQPQQPGAVVPFGSPTPFGAPSPFGTPSAAPNSPNGVNTLPIFGTPGTPQRTP